MSYCNALSTNGMNCQKVSREGRFCKSHTKYSLGCRKRDCKNDIREGFVYCYDHMHSNAELHKLIRVMQRYQAEGDTQSALLTKIMAWQVIENSYEACSLYFPNEVFNLLYGRGDRQIEGTVDKRPPGDLFFFQFPKEDLPYISPCSTGLYEIFEDIAILREYDPVRQVDLRYESMEEKNPEQLEEALTGFEMFVEEVQEKFPQLGVQDSRDLYSRYSEIFVETCLKQLPIYLDDTLLKESMNKRCSDMIEIWTDQELNETTYVQPPEVCDNLRLTEEDVNFLLAVHKKVMSGHLDILTPVNLETPLL